MTITRYPRSAAAGFIPIDPTLQPSLRGSSNPSDGAPIPVRNKKGGRFTRLLPLPPARWHFPTPGDREFLTCPGPHLSQT
jgi:hypothetical protein